MNRKVIVEEDGWESEFVKESEEATGKRVKRTVESFQKEAEMPAFVLIFEDLA